MNTTPPENGEFGQRTTPPRPIMPKTASEALRPEQGTPPPVRARSRHSRNQFIVFLNFVLSAIVLLVLAAVVAVYFGKQAFDGPGPSETVSTIVIKPNTGVQDIAEQLQRRGLISDARLFQLGLRAHGNQAKLKAGEYEIKAHASMRDVMELLKSGKSVLYSITVPEGLTVEQAFKRIAEQDALSGSLPETLPPEGSLAADTQRFTRGTTRQQIVDKMLADQKTGRSDERSRVAAVFINRLKKGMRLQSDPTIIYGLYGGKGKPADKPIYQSDLQKPTPYNTYLISGLPPTPIANPGRAALEAVANPSETDDLYFVADGSGGHVFASSLDEHNENVARWRQVEKKQAEEAAKAGSDAETGKTDAAPQ